MLELAEQVTDALNMEITDVKYETVGNISKGSGLDDSSIYLCIQFLQQ
jgi:hypothetical protein